MMQTDEDVGKIAQATPIMIGARQYPAVPPSLLLQPPNPRNILCAARAMELFLQRLCSNSTEVAAGRKAKTLTTSHL